MTAPLIVTLDFDAGTQAFLDQQRRTYFPPERDVLAAHVTLFHALPGALEAEVRDALAEAARGEVFTVRVAGVRFLGRGVAYELVAPPADRLRSGVAQRFSTVLTRQDAHRFRGHVTIANKLEPDRARELFTQLEASFVPFDGQATGLSLYRYVGGPWEFVASYSFADASPEQGRVT